MGRKRREHRRNYSSAEKTIIKNIKKSRSHVCYYCDKQITDILDLTVDHKEPFDENNTTYENCVICCAKCNNEKRSMNELEFNDYLDYKYEMSKFSKEELESRLEEIVSIFRVDIPQQRTFLRREAQALRVLIKDFNSII